MEGAMSAKEKLSLAAILGFCGACIAFYIGADRKSVV